MTTLVQHSFKTLADFKRVYTGHFFDRKTMAFFKSRIESGLISGAYFITSESNFHNTDRFYTVRSIGRLEDGEYTINTVGKFNELRNKWQAKELIKSHSKNNKVG